MRASARRPRRPSRLISCSASTTGSAAALGIGTGTFVHVLGAALGLSAVLATSASAFTVVKMVGAAYLLYLGIRLLLSAGTQPAQRATAAPTLPLRTVFAQGFLTNVLNPKVALFFLAFVPQFIEPTAPSKALAFIALGGVFYVNSMLWCHALAVFAAAAGQRVRLGASAVRWLNRLVGGLRLALAGRG
jgi:threonine/homoserine/homoserine lactone efflux protein